MIHPPGAPSTDADLRWTLTTHVAGQHNRTQHLADPLHVTRIRIGVRDLLRGLLRGYVIVQVRLDAPREVVRRLIGRHLIDVPTGADGDASG